MPRPWNSKTRCNAAVVIVRSSCGLVPSQSSPTLFLCCIKKTVWQHFVGCVITSWGSGVVASVHNYVSDLAAAAVLLKSVRSVDTPAACGALWLITSLCVVQSLSVTARLHRGSYTKDKHVSSHLCCLLSFCIVLMWAAEFFVYFWSHLVSLHSREGRRKRRYSRVVEFFTWFYCFFSFEHHKLKEISLHYTYLQNSATHGQKYVDWINNTTGEIYVFLNLGWTVPLDPVLYRFKIFRLDVSCVSLSLQDYGLNSHSGFTG